MQNLRIRAVFDRIPAELNEKNKRFFASSVKPGVKFENLGDEFLWLKEAGVALPTVNVEEPKIPLKLAEKPSLFKLFSNDVGLLAAQYMNGVQLRILNGVFYAPVYMVMFLKKDTLPDKMIYTIGAPLEMAEE